MSDPTPETYRKEIAKLLAGARAELEVAQRLSDECVERYGVRFSVPSGADIDEAFGVAP